VISYDEGRLGILAENFENNLKIENYLNF